MSTPDITHPALKQLNFIRNIHCEDAKEDRAIFIKKLESEISKIIQKKTKDLKSRLILLQGNDSETLDAVGSYIYCLYGSGDLCYRSFYGKTEEESKSILNTEEPFSSGEYKKVVVGKSLWERLCCGYTIFLGGLKCNDGLFLEGLSCKIGSVKNDLVDNNSLLIVSTLKKDVPLYFSNHFKLINLEQEKQNTSQLTPKEKVKTTKWRNKDDKVYYGNSFLVELTSLQSKLFNCLCQKENEYIGIEVLKECWDTEPGYSDYLSDAVSKLKNFLAMEFQKKFKDKHEIIELKKSGKHTVGYKLLP